jgi:nitrite reductase/ring-hydroxylating ferredoxin subunit
MGLAILKQGKAVLVYPRLCSHEGASLDAVVKACGSTSASHSGGCTIQCPWHGRKFRPIVTVALPAVASTYETDWHSYEVAADGLMISCKNTVGAHLRNTDWCHSARPVGGS